MLFEDIKSIKSSGADLRKFGLTLGLFLAAIGFISWWRSRIVEPVWIGPALFFLFFAFAAPKFLRPVQKCWMTIALLIGWVMTRVILAVLFYGMVTPMSFVARRAGKKFLDDHDYEKPESYWRMRTSKDRSKTDCEKQY